jgi:hypothetical protein
MAMYQLDEARASARLLRVIASEPICWPNATMDRFSRALGIPLNYGGDDAVARWISVKFARDHTEVFSRFIYYPFVTLLILFVAQSQYFDNWTLPFGIGTVYITVLGISIFSVSIVRQRASEVRDRAIDAWTDGLARYSILEQDQQTMETRSRLQNLIASSEEIRGGAFLPFTREPLVKAALIPLTTIIVKVLEELVAWLTSTVIH